MSKKDIKISIIGSGNVATNLAKSLFSKGFTILQLYSRTFENAKIVAESVSAEPISDIKNLNPEADLYLLSITDSAIENIISEFPKVKGVVVHTAGSIPVTVFENHFENYGVFYPLQTFSKHVDIDLNETPFCIEANSEVSEKFLLNIAKSLSNNVKKVDSKQREALHLSAVFVCNFSNYLYVIADELLEKNSLDFEILKPLIKETTKKLQPEKHPINLQTGPAIRQDAATINKHITKLQNTPDIQEIYALFSKIISSRERY